jgi:hypothetical protein
MAWNTSRMEIFIVVTTTKVNSMASDSFSGKTVNIIKEISAKVSAVDTGYGRAEIV